MMLLFHNKNSDKRESNPATDIKARAMARLFAKKQEKAARWLNRKFVALSHPAQVISLLLFCLVLGGASGWILTSAILPRPEKSTPVAPLILLQKKHRHQPQHLPDSLDKQHYIPPLK